MVVTERAMAGGLSSGGAVHAARRRPALKEFPGSPEASLEVSAGKLRHYLGERLMS